LKDKKRGLEIALPSPKYSETVTYFFFFFAAFFLAAIVVHPLSVPHRGKLKFTSCLSR